MYKIILPIRYLLKRRISYFSVAATALCVFVALVVITVLSGLTGEFKTNTYNSVGDCVVGSRSMVGFGYYQEFMKVLDEADFVEVISPIIKNYAIVKGTIGSDKTPYVNRTLEIMGIDPRVHSRVTKFGQWLHYYKGVVENAFKPVYNPNLPGCVPGIDVLFSRDSEGNYNVTNVVPRLKFEVSCFPLTAKGAAAKLGAGEVNTKTFYLSNIAQSRLAKTDGNIVYLPFNEAQVLCGMQAEPKRVNAIYVKFEPGVKSAAGCDKVEKLWHEFVKNKTDAPQADLLKNVRVQSWKVYSRVVIAAVETEQTMMIVIFGMIGVITVFIVFVVFYMIVSHKSKDIGIMKSVGASNRDVLLLFLTFGSLVAICGSAFGALGGWQFLVHINQIEDWLFEHFDFQLWDRTIYPGISDIPNAIDLKVLAGIILSAIIACLAGALIPSWRAARLKIVDTLQVTQL